jgi:xanthine dehydrogenase iron-sulfur cluster and FAD-binding subunit A
MRDSRIGFGDMAEVPARATAVERALIGETWTEANVPAAMNCQDAALTLTCAAARFPPRSPSQPRRRSCNSNSN